MVKRSFVSPSLLSCKYLSGG